VPTFLVLAAFGAGLALPMTPWLLHNNILRGGSLLRFEMGAPNTLTPRFDLTGRAEEEASSTLRSLPEDLAVDTTKPECQPTGNVEELDRYWGFRTGWSHYLTLPWRTTMNIDSAGYYVTTMPGVLLFPLLLLLPAFWFPALRWLRWLAAGTAFIVLQWMLLANGIPWYGIGMFLGLAIALETLVARAPDLPNRALAVAFVSASILLMLSNRLWQFEIQRNVFEYPIGKVSAQALEERTIPHYDDVARVVVARHESIPDRPYLYRIGTFMPYFIPRNLEIIGVSDHQLDFFNCINQERNHAITTARLKALGFNSIVFDTNTVTIERDPQGSLHRKVETLINYLNDPGSALQVVLHDPGAGIAYILIP
jgi:hypothetical protein